MIKGVKNYFKKWTCNHFEFVTRHVSIVPQSSSVVSSSTVVIKMYTSSDVTY